MRSSGPFFVAALFATLAACADEPTGPSAREAGPGVQPALAMNATTSRVVAYLPTWYAGSLDSIRYARLTHINYAFIDPTPAGGLAGLPMSGDARLTSLVQKAHAAGVKVLISIGGWSGGDDSGFVQMSASSTARAAFVSNVVTFVGNYGLDGVDIDWEYPDAGTAEATSYATMMSELNTALDAEGKLLTAAVAAGGYYGNGILSQVFGYVDFMVLMAYDGGTPHSTYAYADASLDYWLGRGLPASKAVLGVPFYGRDSGSGYKAYRTIVRDDAQAPYADLSGGFHYNGLETMKKKTTLSLQRGSGVGIWELTQDTTLAAISLLEAIHTAMNSPVPPYDYTRVVYDDALVSGWASQSWDVTLNFASTSPVHLGSKAVSATYTAAWGGIYLRHGSGVGPTGLTKLEFYVHGGTAGGQDLRVQIGEPGGWLATRVRVTNYIEGGSVAAGAWRKVTIPLSVFGVTTNPIARLAITDGTGAAQPTFHVDHIRFVP
jgi:GH18 family chitinase